VNGEQPLVILHFYSFIKTTRSARMHVERTAMYIYFCTTPSTGKKGSRESERWSRRDVRVRFESLASAILQTTTTNEAKALTAAR